MPRRGSILDSRSDRSTSRSDRSISSKSFQTKSRHNNKGSTFHQPVYQNTNEYYIPTLGSTHPPRHDYGRVEAYQYCEGFRFQDLFQTQGGFPRDNQLVYGGHNSYRSYGRVDGDDGDDGDVNIRDEDEGDGSNERGVCDEDPDGHALINNDDWNQMIKDVWSTPEFQKRSESARRNRLTKTNGKISTHSGETVSFASYRANMEKYKMEMISKYGTNRENHPSFDGATWCVASGGVTKGRVYGAPRMPKSIVSTSSSSHSYLVESSYLSSSYRALQQEIKDKEEEIKKKDDFILEMKRQMDSMQEHLVNNLGYHGGTSNIGQGMPPSMAPQIMTHMGPTSQPLYRPIPRPLYPDQSCIDQLIVLMQV
ncbi:hypothetical protein D5086_005504 [Populus alba]|uniref:Uncharacterized protein n=1 Tax=Populus alba TaxID=43335 RepID=A0ACC4CTF0_POPAL